MHRDYLGSILAITNAGGAIVEKRHFDAWGNLVFVKDGQNNDLTKLTFLDRGYTGHEHLQGVALINMNARLYDPVVKRFLAPDNFVQYPTNTQNSNRYGYVLNNPLVYVDQNGEFWFVAVGALIGGYLGASVHQGSFYPAKWDSDWWKGAIVGAVVGAYGGQMLATSVGAFASGGISSGTAFSNVLMATGEGMIKSYATGIFSFDLDKGFNFNFGLDKERINQMLIGGAIKGANKLMEIGFADVLTKMEAEVLSTPLRDMTSNLIKGEPVFKRVSFYKLGNGVVDLGIGKKVFNVNKLEEHLMGWGMYGAAGMFDLGDTPEFRVFNLSFNYDNNKESLTGMFGHWWNKMDSIDKIAFGGMVATFGGIVSTIGVNIQF